jgi:hypothetical protein
MRPDLNDLNRDSLEIYPTREVEGLKLKRISIGSFAGTEERVFVIKQGQTHAFDTGDQGGGQT